MCGSWPGVSQVMCDLTTKSTQFPPQLLSPRREAGASLASESFQAFSYFPGLPELPAKLLEADPQSSPEAHWTTNQENLDVNPHFALHKLGDLRQVTGLSEITCPCLQSEGSGTTGWLLGKWILGLTTFCAYLPSAPV